MFHVKPRSLLTWAKRLAVLALGLVPFAVLGWTRDPHRQGVGAVAFSPDGRSLATVSYAIKTRELRVWDVATGRERRGDRRVVTGNRALELSADGSSVAVSTPQGPRPLAEFAGWAGRALFDGRVSAGGIALLFSDGRTLATSRLKLGDLDTEVTFWDTATGARRNALGDGQRVDGLAASADGRTLAAIGGDRLVVWDVATGKATTQPPNAPPFCCAPIAVSPDGSLVVAQAEGNALPVWDHAAGLSRASLSYGQADSLAFSADGTKLVVADYGKGVDVWDLSGAGVSNPVRFLGHADSIQTKALQHATRMIPPWLIARGTVQRRFQFIANSIWSVAFSPDGTLVASADQNGTARVWESATGREVHVLTHAPDGPAAWVWALAWGWLALCLAGLIRSSMRRSRGRTSADD